MFSTAFVFFMFHQQQGRQRKHEHVRTFITAEKQLGPFQKSNAPLLLIEGLWLFIEASKMEIVTEFDGLF